MLSPRHVTQTARRSLTLRRAVVLLLGFLVVAGLFRTELDTSVGSFVPASSDSFSELNQRDADFGGDPIVVVLKGSNRNGLLLESDQLMKLIALEGDLATNRDVAVVYGPGTVLNQTAGSIQNFLAQTSGRRDALINQAQARAERQNASKADIKKARDAAVVKFDRRYGSMIARGLPMGLPTTRNQRFVASVLLDKNGNPRAEWSFLVPDAKSATILIRPRDGLNQRGAERLVADVRQTVDRAGLAVDKPLITGVPVLSSALSERARTEVPMLGAIALIAVGLVLWFSRWTTRRRDRLRPLLAAMLGTATTLAIFGLLGQPLSLGVVAFLPIIVGIGSDFPIYLAQRERRTTVLVAAAAAAAAFGSLTFSALPFVAEFGVALVIGLAATIGWSLLLAGGSPRSDQAHTGGSADSRWAKRVSLQFNPTGRKVALAAGALVAAAGLISLPFLRIESSPDQLARGISQLNDLDKAERVLGFSGEINVVLRGNDVLSPAALEWQRKATETIVTQHADQARPLLTTDRLLSFLGTGADATQISSGAELLPSYLLGGVVSADRSAGSSSFGVTVSDIAAQAKLIDQITAAIGKPPAGYQAAIVGLPVVASDGLSAMQSNRYVLNAIGLVAAVLVIYFGLRSVRLSLQVALAALLSAGWVFAALRLLGESLSPLTLAVGALTTVTACEFTTMLATAPSSLRSVAVRSVLTSATAGTLGYLVLTLSDLQVLADFGLVLAGGVVSSLLASALVTTTRPNRATSASSESVTPLATDQFEPEGTRHG